MTRTAVCTYLFGRPRAAEDACKSAGVMAHYRQQADRTGCAINQCGARRWRDAATGERPGSRAVGSAGTALLKRKGTMNTYQAKRIPFRDLLAALGYEPRREVRGELWYLSPLRQEASASFKVNVAGNVWYDFGEGRGGNLLDFVMAYYRLDGDVKAALEKLDGLGVSAGEPVAPALARGKPPASPRNGPESSITLVKTQVLRNRALFDYLHARGIKPITAKPFVREAYYTIEGRDRTFFALAFPNE